MSYLSSERTISSSGIILFWRRRSTSRVECRKRSGEGEDGGAAVVKNSAAFGEDVKVTKGTLTVEGGSFGAAVDVEGDGTMNVNGGSFTGTGLDKVS